MPSARRPKFSKLTDEVKAEILVAFKQDPSRDRKQLARKFSVAPDTVSLVLREKGYGYSNGSCKSCGRLDSLDYAGKVRLIEWSWYAKVSCRECGEFNWSCAAKFMEEAQPEIKQAKAERKPGRGFLC